MEMRAGMVENNNPEVTFLIPCLNEELTLPHVINEIRTSFDQTTTVYEILVADNGSTDSSVEVSEKLGARVVNVEKKGYGAALIGGINASRGEIIVMGDADGSYHFEDSKQMISLLKKDVDLVVGNRFRGGIEKGAMPFLHKYLGNPVLSFIARLFYDIPIYDFHCGLRGFKKSKIQKIGLTSFGMEFASEMIVKSKMSNLVIKEVPAKLSKDLRNREPHLRTWRDGWRHLKFLFSYSPKWAFKVPATISLVLAALPVLLITFGQGGLGLFGLNLSYKSSIFSMALSLLSANFFWAFTVAKEIEGNESPIEGKSLTPFLLSSSLCTITGMAIFLYQLISWASTGFSEQNLGANLFLGIFSAFLIAAGASSLTFTLTIGFIRTKFRDS
jgi:glycosyltransferase involved in cell wall biosynthesis